MGGANAPYGVGIIGCGWASTVHARGYRLAPDVFDVRVCCDTNADSAAERSEEFANCRAATDWREVIADPEIAVIDICLPHHLHHPVAIAAAEAGKHILVEKPLARSLQEAREIADAVEKAGVTLMVAFNERYTWQARTIREIVDSGRIGNVYMVRTDHNQDTKFPDTIWYRSADLVGGGALIGSGIHMLDLLRWFGGDVSEVFCATHTIPERLNAEIAALVSVKYADGGLGSLDITWASPAKPWYQFLVVYGTKGRVTTLGNTVVVAVGKDVETFNPPGDEDETDSYAQEVIHFGRCLRDGREPLTNVNDAVKTQELVEAAYRSAAENRPVPLPL